ncbi:MAG: ATP-binding protein [Anaerolineae bacterium]|nr:ATP-binding protein [Anaerolineae bacterium]
MSTADDLWAQSGVIFDAWGLSEIPFTESAIELGQKQLRQLFTGRENELRQVFNLVRGRERKRIFVYGWVGIGKTAFLREIIGVLERNAPKTLASYISLLPGMDLSTAALIALARKLPKDEYAQHLLTQMGLPASQRAVEKKTTVKAGLSGSGVETTEETSPFSRPLYPAASFEALLDRAYQKFERIVIGIDDLEKRNPDLIRQMLRDEQGLLKSNAWFFLTGHPATITHDILVRELGLFDLALELKPLDQTISYHMLVNYLNSVRPKEKQRNYDEPQAVWPFTPDTARELCARSEGIPRMLNRLGSYVLLKAAELGAPMITPDIFQAGVEFADQQLRGQSGLTIEEMYILELVLDKGVLSDESVTLEELDKVRAKEFREILPILDNLVQRDLLKRLPSERATEYAPSPLVLTPKSDPPV